MENRIKFTDYQIDSRDIIERLEELKAIETKNLGDQEQEELDFLNFLQEELSNHPDWKDGIQLLNSSYREKHLKELLVDCYNFPKEPFFLYNHVDWEQACDSFFEYCREVEYPHGAGTIQYLVLCH